MKIVLAAVYTTVLVPSLRYCICQIDSLSCKVNIKRHNLLMFISVTTIIN